MPQRLIVSETNFHNKQKGMLRSCGIWDQRWKVIHNYNRRVDRYKGILPVYELYDLQNDPHEINNLNTQRKDLTEEIVSSLQIWQEEKTPVLDKETTQKEFLVESIDPEIQNQLKALGYIK